jgi:hypothetical protein
MRIYITLFLLILLGFKAVAQNIVNPLTLTTLSTTVNESSGLINIDGMVWTHNDSGGLPAIYQVDTSNGSIIRTVTLLGATNVDWEDITFDSDYVYIGDFGNNSGSRTDLKIYRISRAELASGNSVIADVIPFSFSDQTSWIPSPNQTDFDCEAFIAWQGNLYLFSKDWVDHKTRMYELSAQPGTHVAQYHSAFDAQGLITGAEMLPSGVLVLQGYTSTLSPFTWLFQQFTGNNFFSGTSTKLTWPGIAQTEGVCYADSIGIYVSSEKIGFPLNFPATLFYLDLSDYLINPPPSGTGELKPQYNIYADRMNIYVKSKNVSLVPAVITITNQLGKVFQSMHEFLGSDVQIPFSLEKGIYIVTIHTRKGDYSAKILVP